MEEKIKTKELIEFDFNTLSRQTMNNMSRRNEKFSRKKTSLHHPSAFFNTMRHRKGDRKRRTCFQLCHQKQADAISLLSFSDENLLKYQSLITWREIISFLIEVKVKVLVPVTQFPTNPLAAQSY